MAVVSGCATLPELDSRSPAEEIQRFYAEEVGDPKCSVAIIDGPHICFAGDEHAIYRVGSLTKLFAAEAIYRLDARGDIDLDTPVTRYSKYDLPPEFETVTLRELLTHTSGMPMDFLNPWNPLDWHVALMSGLVGQHLYAAFEEKKDFAEHCWTRRVRSALKDRKPQYSNVGFALLVSAIEDHTGRTLDNILDEEVCGPMGLHDTAFSLDAEQLARKPVPSSGKLPWLARRGSPVDAHELGPALRGMGGLHSSTADCAAFFSRIDCTRPGYLAARQLPSGRWIDYRFGMIYGGESFFCRDRESGRMLIILRNVTSWPAAEDFEIADRLFRNSACRVFR